MRHSSFSIRRDRTLDDTESTNVTVTRLLILPRYRSLAEPDVVASFDNRGAVAYDEGNGVLMFSNGLIWQDVASGILPPQEVMFLRYNTGPDPVALDTGLFHYLVFGQPPTPDNPMPSFTVMPREGVLSHLTLLLPLGASSPVTAQAYINNVTTSPALTVTADDMNPHQSIGSATVMLGDIVTVALTVGTNTTGVVAVVSVSVI